MEKYMNPPIPKGFVHVSGTWDKAFIIEDVKSKNRFTWIPLGCCPEVNEYLKGYMFTGAGRDQNYDLTKDMIDLYKGMYVSTYVISKTDDGKPVSAKGHVWNNITYKQAKLKTIEMCKAIDSVGIQTRLLYEVEFDMILQTIAYLLNQANTQITTEQFEKFGLYDVNEFWSWTLTNYSECAMVIKKGGMQIKEVYANNESYKSPLVGFRTVLIVF